MNLQRMEDRAGRMERLESRIRSGMYQVAKFAATWSCGDARNIATVSFVLDHPVEMPSQQKVFRIKHNTWSLWSSTKRHSSSKTRNWCGGAVTVESGLPQFPVEAPGTGKEKCKTICDARSGARDVQRQDGQLVSAVRQQATIWKLASFLAWLTDVCQRCKEWCCAIPMRCRAAAVAPTTFETQTMCFGRWFSTKLERTDCLNAPLKNIVK